MSIELEYRESSRALVARFSCDGEPGLLQRGGVGWFARSQHIDWRCGWRLCVQCGVTVPKLNYGYEYLRPEAGTREFLFKHQQHSEKLWDCGSLVVEDQLLISTFPIPDCLDPPFKSFKAWGQPILLGERMFHCQIRLETRGPKDGSHLRRIAATTACAGGIEIATDEAVLAVARDSEGTNGRGRKERIDAVRIQRGISNSEWLAMARKLKDAEEFVDRHPTRTDGDCSERNG